MNLSKNTSEPGTLRGSPGNVSAAVKCWVTLQSALWAQQRRVTAGPDFNLFFWWRTEHWLAEQSKPANQRLPVIPWFTRYSRMRKCRSLNHGCITTPPLQESTAQGNTVRAMQSRTLRLWRLSSRTQNSEWRDPLSRYYPTAAVRESPGWNWSSSRKGKLLVSYTRSYNAVITQEATFCAG